jgi:hypothetical protein
MVLAHANAYDVLIALAVPLNTALIVALTLLSVRTHKKTRHVEQIVNGMVGPTGEPQKAIVEPVSPRAGGRRSYDPPNDERK